MFIWCVSTTSENFISKFEMSIEKKKDKSAIGVVALDTSSEREWPNLGWALVRACASSRHWALSTNRVIIGVNH